jgi:hypothetical protein
VGSVGGAAPGDSEVDGGASECVATVGFAVLAVASGASDQPLPAGLIAVGELGLAGDIRPVRGLERRLAEASKEKKEGGRKREALRGERAGVREGIVAKGVQPNKRSGAHTVGSLPSARRPRNRRALTRAVRGGRHQRDKNAAKNSPRKQVQRALRRLPYTHLKVGVGGRA